MLYSPRMTRSQTAIHQTSAGSETEAENPALLAAMRELRELREERERDRLEMEELRRNRRGEEQQGQGETQARQGQYRSNSNVLNLRPDIYDGGESLDEYLAQFEFVAQANMWSVREKGLVLAASLRGKARSILDGMGECCNYTELKSKLVLRFGGGHCFQERYSQFINRKMRIGEDFASYGGELEKLARLAYPECPFEVRDKIACAQFIIGIPEGWIRRTLQLEGISSLRAGIERAKAIQVIEEEERFPRDRRREREESYGNLNSGIGNKRKGTKENSQRSGRECWQCGGTDHFRADCPALSNHRSGN